MRHVDRIALIQHPPERIDHPSEQAVTDRHADQLVQSPHRHARIDALAAVEQHGLDQFGFEIEYEGA